MSTEKLNPLDILASKLPVITGADRRAYVHCYVEGNRAVASFVGRMPTPRVEIQFKRDGRILGACSCQKTSATHICKHVNFILKELVGKRVYDHLRMASDSPPKQFSKLFLLNEGVQDEAETWRYAVRALQETGALPVVRTAKSFPANRQIRYELVLDSDEYAEDDWLTLRLRLFNTQTSRSTQFNLGADTWLQCTDPLDQEIAKVVCSAQLDDYGYSRHRSDTFCLHPTRIDLLKRIAESGRLSWLEDRYGAEPSPIRWIGETPFHLVLKVEPTKKETVEARLALESGSLRIEVSQLKVLCRPSLFITASHIGQFDEADFGSLTNFIRNGAAFAAPQSALSDFVDEFSKVPGLPKLEFAPELQTSIRQISCAPRPRLRLKPKEVDGHSKLAALVSFDYEGVIIDADQAETTLFDRAAGTLLRRDIVAEQKYMQRLDDIGFRWSFIGARERYPVIGVKRLPHVVETLMPEGWHIDAEGKLYRPGKFVNIKVSSGIDWFEVSGNAEFDGQSIPFPKLLQALIKGEKTIVLDDGTIGMIPQEWLKRYGSIGSAGNAKGDAIHFDKRQIGMLDALLAELPGVDVDAQFDAARTNLRRFEHISPKPAPKGFGGILRPYQEMSQGWFEFLREFGFGGCLADDMGLGKTIQVLAMLEARRQHKCGPSLVVVPRSLIFNWTAEAKKFTPKLRVLDQSHAARTRSLDPIREHDLILSTYGTLRKDAEYLKDMQFDYVILDESQAIKNPTTDAAKAARLLRGNHRLAMSGTPIENHLGELWSLMEFLNPGMLGRSAAFKRIAGDPGAAEQSARSALARAVRPFVLRRTKSQVATDLPERIEQTIQIELDPAHRKAYDELRNHYRAALKDKIEKDGVGKSQIIVLEALLRLRQSACHVGLLDGAKAGSGSAKFDMLMEQLKQIIESGQKALVFSQFTSLLALLKPIFEHEKIPFEYLDGQTRDRQACVERFQKDEACKVFLISLKAGGVGLNLTAAGYVFLLDPWWNPAAEAQAIDRAHRIGQTQTVIASRLIARDTVEERVLELQKRKRDLANAIITDDNAAVSGLTRDDIELLLS